MNVSGEEVGWIEALFKWLVGIVGIGFAAWNGFIMTAVSKNTEGLITLKDLIAKHELEDARTYVSRQDFKETVIDMKDTVKRIYEKMDQVLDKLDNSNRK